MRGPWPEAPLAQPLRLRQSAPGWLFTEVARSAGVPCPLPLLPGDGTRCTERQRQGPGGGASRAGAQWCPLPTDSEAPPSGLTTQLPFPLPIPGAASSATVRPGSPAGQARGPGPTIAQPLDASSVSCRSRRLSVLGSKLQGPPLALTLPQPHARAWSQEVHKAAWQFWKHR